MFPDVFESAYVTCSFWIRLLSMPHSSGEFGSESRYFCFVWTGKFFNLERKSCGFRKLISRYVQMEV